MVTLDERAAGGRRFADRVCVVTGSGQGIGRATARRLAQEGGTIVIAERNEEGARRVYDELTEFGAPAKVFLTDLSTADKVKELFAFAIAEFDHIDVLVNCVGGSIWSKFGWEYTEEELEKTVHNNFWTCLWANWAVLPHMIERRSGAIVNLGSNAPRGTMRLPYAASKGGVFAITTSMALETAELGVRINCVAPHWTQAPDRLVDRRGDAVQPGTSGSVAPNAERHLANIPMRRAGNPEEQAATIAFLASDDASFITGQIISCSGGAVAY